MARLLLRWIRHLAVVILCAMTMLACTGNPQAAATVDAAQDAAPWLEDAIQGTGDISLVQAKDGEWELFLDYNFPDEAPGSGTFFNADMGIHNQSYHFDGAYHYSAGTDRGRPTPLQVAADGAVLAEGDISNGWVFVNHDAAGYPLLCKSNLGNPFVNYYADDESIARAIHPGGGYFHDGRMYSVISNSPEGDDTGLFAMVSFALDPACTSDNCECDVRWLNQDGQPTTNPLDALVYEAEPRSLLLQPTSTYYGLVNRMTVDGGEKGVVYSIAGGVPWVCDLDGANCAPAGNSVGALDGLWPQECLTSGGYQICTPYPGVLPNRIGEFSARLNSLMTTPALAMGSGAGRIFVFKSNAGDDGRILRPLATLDISGDENPGTSDTVKQAVRSEGIAIYDGQLYLATHFSYEGDEKNVPDRCIGMPCTSPDGKQRVLVFDVE